MSNQNESNTAKDPIVTVYRYGVQRMTSQVSLRSGGSRTVIHNGGPVLKKVEKLKASEVFKTSSQEA